MTQQTPLTTFVDALPPQWKWSRGFQPPREFAAEWQKWLAEAERAETETTLHYWATRGEQRAA